jgi:hypothetical protein
LATHPTRWGPVINTPYGTARVNTNGRILWAEWDVWRHSEDLVEAGLWTSKRSMYGTRERVEYYAVDVEG